MGRKDRNAGKQKAPNDRAVSRRLFEDEQLIMVARPNRLSTFPKFVLTLGLYAFWRRRDTASLTDQRILLGKGLLHRSEHSIPLSHVEDVAYVRSGLSSYVELTVTDRYRGQPIKRIGPLSSRTAHKMSKEILRRV